MKGISYVSLTFVEQFRVHLFPRYNILLSMTASVPCGQFRDSTSSQEAFMQIYAENRKFFFALGISTRGWKWLFMVIKRKLIAIWYDLDVSAFWFAHVKLLNTFRFSFCLSQTDFSFLIYMITSASLLVISRAFRIKHFSPPSKNIARALTPSPSPTSRYSQAFFSVSVQRLKVIRRRKESAEKKHRK